MATPERSFDVPYRDAVVEKGGLLTTVWAGFIRNVYERLRPLGEERTFTLVNDQDEAADIVGLKFNARGVSQATIEYLVQRITTGGSAVEDVESGVLIAAYQPTSEEWSLFAVSEHNPDDAGITFSITAAGQVQYETTSVAGTAFISRIAWRTRTLAARHPIYSSQGAR